MTSIHSELEPKQNQPDIRGRITNADFTNYTDAKIWQEFKQGSDLAMSYIYSEYVNPLFNYGCQINNDEQLVSDCIQELFLELIRNREGLGDVQSIKSYLFTAVRRKILRKLKNERGLQLNTIDEDFDTGFEISYSPEEELMNAELDKDRQRIIASALQNLTSKQREVILLYFYEGFSYKQIAEVMGMGKVKSARVMVYRSIEVLQKALLRIKDRLLSLSFLIIQVFS